MQNDVLDVIVIGAGLAGLATARQLQSQGISTLVLEARGRIGGRVHSAELPDGTIADFGAQLIGPTQTRIQALAAEAGATKCAIRVKGRRVREANSKLSISDRFSLVKMALSLHLESRKTPVSSPWLHPQADHLDTISTAQWLRSHGTAGAAKFWTNIASTSFCANPENFSMLEGLHHLATIGGITGLASAESHYLENGASILSNHLAKNLDILLDTTVISVRRDDHHVVVQTSTDQLLAKQVVIALPPQLGKKLLSVEDAQKMGYIDSTIPVNVVKTVLVYNLPWWRDAGYSGFASSAAGPINELFDFSNKKASNTSKNRNGVLTALSTGETARLLPADESARNDLIANHVGKLFNDNTPTPVFVQSVNWSEETFSQGGYASMRSPGSWIERGKLSVQNTGPIYAAGTETATRWRSYMEGALVSAEEVASSILKPYQHSGQTSNQPRAAPTDT